MFLNNKTLSWLESKDTQEQQELMKKASKGVKNLRDKYKSRLKEIEENRSRVINETIARREDLRREKLRKQELYTTNILKHGLWQSENHIDNMVLSYVKKSDKIEALKVQLKFRKEVLNQIPDDKSVFNFTKTKEGTKSRKNLTVEELITNLKMLVRQSIVRDNLDESDKHVLVGKRVKHRFDTNGEDQWYTGKVISQVQIYHKIATKPI